MAGHDSVASPARLWSHEARGVAELRARDERVKKVAATPGRVLIVEDWWMKVLSLPFREGMFYIRPHCAVSFCLSLTPSRIPHTYVLEGRANAFVAEGPTLKK